jgi:Uma2 family endonuclease
VKFGFFRHRPGDYTFGGSVTTPEGQGMAITKPRHLLALEYAKYAEEYLRGLPPEHFMEATGQSKQREITLESLALLRAKRPEVQVFNELLVQYPVAGEARPHQVVPDNMVVVHDEPIKARTSFNLPLQPVGPFWVLEYVSKESERKDYDDSFRKYERELKVPYYLIFYPDEQELTLYRHTKRRYVSVKPNEHGRLALPQLDLEMGLLGEWCRFWYQGELLLLPGDLLHQRDEARRTADEERRARLAAERELEALRAQLKRRQDKPGEK